MIISRITGGLGNQMFQYAFGRRLAKRHNTELKLDIGFYSNPKINVPLRNYDLDIFNICENFASEKEVASFAERVRLDLVDRALNRILGPKKSHIREPHLHFSRSAFDSPDNVYLNGYWQSEKYFEEAESVIRREFTFRGPPSENAKRVLERIESTNSVCVHVRRGDYINNPWIGLHGIPYFRSAELTIAPRVPNPTYFVFSDDLQWCESNLTFGGPTVFVSDDFGERKFRDDLRLMSACKHFIIANSSFSWWAAWLNENPKKLVVAPGNWVVDPSIDKSDMYLPGWIRL